MAGFLGRLLGAQQQSEAASDPVPGIGGYIYPPGPVGATGYPGSTSSRRINPQLARKNAGRGVTGGGIGAPNNPVQAQQAHRQDVAGEFHGGLPIRDSSSATYVGPQYQESEVRSKPRLSQGVPGPNVRNTWFQQGNVPGAPASSGPMGTSVPAGPNRFVWGGVNGGVEINEALERKIPYAPKGRGNPVPAAGKNVRAATLDGIRFTMPPPVMVPQRDGYGTARRNQGNRPTVFTEPAPWSAQFYDTTSATGGPDSPGTAAPVPSVYVSPSVPRSNNWRRGG
jgi:hypothetical protein